MPESHCNKHRDYSIFDNMSTETLEDILRADSQFPNGENSNTDAILYIMEVIANREREHPTGKFTDVHTAWESFRANYFPYVKDHKSLYEYDDMAEQTGVRQISSLQPTRPQKNRRFTRIACIAAAIIAMMLAGTLTANALGFDLWGTVAKWTKNTFGFSSTVSDAPTSDDSNEYKSLKDALDRYGITAEVVPSWLPDGYVFRNVIVNETPVKISFSASYAGYSDEISVTIVLLVNTQPLTYEKDDGNIVIYPKQGIDYYIMSNIEHSRIVWRIDNLECSISGKFTLEDAKKIIESI